MVIALLGVVRGSGACRIVNAKQEGPVSGSGRGHNQTVALTSQLARKQPLMTRPAPGDRRPPSGGPLTHWKAPPYHGARQQRSFDCRGTG